MKKSNKITSLFLVLILIAGAFSVRYFDRESSAEAMTGRASFADNVSLSDLADTIGKRLGNGGDTH